MAFRRLKGKVRSGKKKTMYKIAQIISPRPNLVKFINITGKDVVINTGQHFSFGMKCRQVECKYNLDKVELGEILTAVTNILEKEKPDCVIVYGDTRSALAGALAADEGGFPLAHIEAGVRLGDMTRPEERIRKIIDCISDYLFCVNDFHAENLERENVAGEIFIVGDLHYDRYLQNRSYQEYVLATIHRAENTDTKDALRYALEKLKRKELVLFPIHPRTKVKMKEFGLKPSKNVRIMTPFNYTEMQDLIKKAKLVITDSGGVCREAWFAGTPVEFIGKSEWETELRMFGDGNAERKIRETLLKCLKAVR